MSVGATPVSSDGTTAGYNFTVTGGTNWARFNGATKLAGATATTGQFTVPVPVLVPEVQGEAVRPLPLTPPVPPPPPASVELLC